jgi:hypothetical protein
MGNIKFYMAFIKIFKSISLIILLSLSPSLMAGSAPIVDDLVSAFNEGDTDKVLLLINKAKGLSYQGDDLISFIYHLWKDNDFPELRSNKLVKIDIVRINIADFLIQANKNGLKDINKEEIRNYAHNLLARDNFDVDVISQTLFVLANIDNPEDIKLMAPFFNSKNDYLFRSSTLALAMMCNSIAENKLIEIEKEEQVPDRHEYIVDIQKKFKILNEYRCKSTKNK